MAVMLRMEFPATIDEYDAVNEKLNAEADPPEGMIIHTGADIGNGMVRIVDVWESEDHYHRFNESRLSAAVTAVMGEMPADAPPPPEPEFTELHTVIKS